MSDDITDRIRQLTARLDEIAAERKRILAEIIATVGEGGSLSPGKRPPMPRPNS
jgi:hypothetical protein